MALISIQNICATVGEGEAEKEVLHNLSMEINEGQTCVLMGPNGAGKSTLAGVLMGNGAYHIKSGTINFLGEDITNLSTSERAKKGLFLSFQAPPEVGGVSLSSFLKRAKEATSGEHVKAFAFQKEIEKNMEQLNLSESYSERELNVGFSGGERKKSEILQLLTLKPKFAILDEADSGLDVDAARVVSSGVELYKAQSNGTLLIITHSTAILSALKVDKTFVIVSGSIKATGDGSLVTKITQKGFDEYL